jgi:hypothetical protein
MPIQLEARAADVHDLERVLKQQYSKKLDLVTPIINLRAEGGLIRIAGTGVFEDALFRPTPIADGHFADKLKIPAVYMRRMREERIDLYDLNFNGWVHGSDEPNGDGFYPPDPRTVTCRLYQADPGEVGYFRAMLSDRPLLIDNLDVLTAALEGVKEAGIRVTIPSCNLSETRMVVKVDAPDVAGAFPEFMRGYRNPFGETSHYGALGDPVRGHPGAVVGQIISAGAVFTNSETGHGQFAVYPYLTCWACANGMPIEKDGLRRIHLGARLDEGIVTWSDDTQRKSLELVTAQTKDAIQTFLSPEYLNHAIAELTTKAGKPVTDAPKTIEVVTKTLGFSDDVRAGVLDFFIKGGQATAGGVMQAVTAYSQVVESPDLSWDLELAAIRALELAAA